MAERRKKKKRGGLFLLLGLRLFGLLLLGLGAGFLVVLAEGVVPVVGLG